MRRNQKQKTCSARTIQVASSFGGVVAVVVFTGVSAPVRAQTIVTLPPISIKNSPAPLTPLSDTTLSGKALASNLPSATDIPHLLGPVPGLSLQTGGAVSTLPVLNGLADDRVNILVDGMSITSSCGNHMNPPLAYFDPSAVARIQVLPGVTPVSLGGDSIGGTINVEQAPPKFARKGQSVLWDGQLSVYYRSNGNGISTDGALSAATSNMSIGYAGTWGQSEDYKDGNGHKVLSTNYQESNHYITLGFKNIAGGTLVIRGGIQSMPYQGFANQRMDMNGNHSQFVNANFSRDFDWGKLDSTLFYHNVNHYMNFLSDKITSPGTQMPMYTHGRDFGYNIKLAVNLDKRNTLNIGSDLDDYRLNDWWPPVSGSMMMGPNTYENIHNGQRTKFGVFSEWQANWTPKLSTLFGVRVETVWANTGQVQPYSWGGMSIMDGDAAAAQAFNAMNRARTDVNVDLSAMLQYHPTDQVDLGFGYGREARSPNLYERYSWGADTMARSMIGWFGDANLYVGNPNLKPEIANTVSGTIAWHDPAKQIWGIKLTPYYTYVQDFIGVTRIGNYVQGGTTFAELEFMNRNAQLYGIDLSGKLRMLDSAKYGMATLNGTLNWVQGNYMDTGNSLYHMMPLNAVLGVEHRIGGWTSNVDLRLVAAKTLVDSDRSEPTTPGFAVLNMGTSYSWSRYQLSFQAENLLNQQYYEPLGGVDYADWKAGGDKGQIGALPAPGRSLIVGLTVRL